MKDEYLDGIHNNTSIIRTNVEWLSDLSKAFRMTGNDFLAKELAECAKDLYDAQKEIQNVVARELNRQCSEARDEAGKILNLAITHLVEDKNSEIS